MFGSIGYATGTAAGAFIAINENKGKHNRGILITGEGSMQLTIQAISDLHRYGRKPIIFLIENGGCTVKRLIHGKTAPYNAVPILDYAKLGDVFGPEYKSFYFGPIDTPEKLGEVLESKELNDTNCLDEN